MKFDCFEKVKTSVKLKIAIRIAVGCLTLSCLLSISFGQRLNHLEIPIQSGVGVPVAYNGIGMWRLTDRLSFGDEKFSTYSHVDVPIAVAGLKQIVAGTLRSGDNSLNAPFLYNQKDFPLVMDRGNEAIVKAIAIFTDDPIVNMNLFYLLTFFSNFVLFAIGILIWRGSLSFWDIAISIAFCLTPFHFIQGQFFIMNQGGIILGVAVVLRILGEKRVSFLGLGATALCVPLFGMYWTFFFAGLLTVVCLCSLRNIRTRVHLIRLWLMLLLTSSLAAFIDFYPSLVYWAKYGATSVISRSVAQNDSWPFRVMDLVLFPTYSIVKIPEFSRNVLQDSPIIGEASGLFAPLGMVVLITAILAIARGMKNGISDSIQHLGDAETDINRQQVMFLCLGIISVPLIGSVGGFGTIFNNFFPSPIKSWERVAIVFQILALNLVSVFLYKWKPRLRMTFLNSTRNRNFGQKDSRSRISALMAASLIVTLVVSIPIGWSDNFDSTKKMYDSDRTFFTQVEEVVESGMVFSFPVEIYPEGPEVCTSIPYGTLIGNMFTKTVRWSGGAVKGRDFAWQVAINNMPLEESANRLMDLGFKGIVISKRGYSLTAFTAIMKELRSHSNGPLLMSKDGMWVFSALVDLFKVDDFFKKNNKGYKRVERTIDSTTRLNSSEPEYGPLYSCPRF